MPNNTEELYKNWVLVIGEECLDVFIYGSAVRLCPDVPAPVFVPSTTSVSFGMAGNTAENLKGMWVKSKKITQITQTAKPIKKTRYVDSRSNYTFLRVDEGEDSVEPYNDILTEKVIRKYDAVVISDYGKGFLSERDIEKFCVNNPNTFLDTKKVLGDFCKEAKIIKINSPEFEGIKSKIKLEDWKDKLIVTLGEKGCMYLRGGTAPGFHYYPTDSVDVCDVSGAGDTFLAALVAKYLQADNMDNAIKFANNKSKEAVQQKGVVAIRETKNAKQT